MHFFLKYFTPFIILFSLLSCQKVIEIDLPPTDSKVVVNSFFSDGSQIKVHLSKSIGVLENGFPECNNAIVDLLVNNEKTDILYPDDGYFYSHLLAERGKNYSLIVSVPDMDSVFCEDIIPENTIIQSCVFTDSVLIDEDGHIIKQLKLDFIDPAGPNFYELELEGRDILNNEKVFTRFTKNSDPIITSTGLLDYSPRTLIFTDKMFDGKRCSVKVYFTSDWYRDYSLGVILRSVSESYYKFKEKQFAYLFSLDSDIFSGMSEPINLYSNITGGYGIFAGYSYDDKTIICR